LGDLAVLRSRWASAFCAGALAAIAGVGPAAAQPANILGALSEVPLPGGLPAALAVIDDRVAADRGRFLLEFIRRTHQGPTSAHPGEAARLQALLAHLGAAPRGDTETLPLPLTPAIWIDVVFGGGITEHGLVGAILGSRQASLLYYALLSLDATTRGWIAARRDVLTDLAARHAAALVVAGPALRVADARVRVPGGDRAVAIWENLTGASVREPEAFVRALLGRQQGRLAYFFAAMAQLSPPQLEFVLGLGGTDEGRRLAAARRMQAIFDRLAATWNVSERPFWRPASDPALLASQLRVNDRGRPVVPGSTPFWEAVFALGPQTTSRWAVGRGAPVDPVWLFEQVFMTAPDERRRREGLVLFASRTLGAITEDSAIDAVDAVRARSAYPAAALVLERAGVTGVRLVTPVARRAAALAAIRDHQRAFVAVVQFQGALAAIARAAWNGSLSPAATAEAVSSLAAVDLSPRGEYEGRLVRWMEAFLQGMASAERRAGAPASRSCAPLYVTAPGTMDCDLLRMLAGPVPEEPRFVEWEGTRYRIDFAAAEATRLGRLLGADALPYLSAARTLLGIADALVESRVDPEGLRHEAETLGLVHRALWPGAGSDVQDRTLIESLQRLAADGNVAGATPLALQARSAADAWFARGLLDVTYAAALGDPERVLLSARGIASRHEFHLGARGPFQDAAWQLPKVGGLPTGASTWHVSGALLGLDVKLAEFSLRRVSSRSMPRKPTVYGEDRRLFIELVSLVEPRSLTDADSDVLVTAIRTGRARLGAARSRAEVDAIADAAGLSHARRALLAWMVDRDPSRTAAFLSRAELLWLGLDDRPVHEGLHAWGAPAEPRLGCLCLRLPDRRPWETLAGQSNSGQLASGFPDLNLRLAELLHDLRMPAAMLAPVLAAATSDLLEGAERRDPGDRRALVEFVQALSVDRVEQYLALLTADGPLVPLGPATGTAANTGGAQ
jgi:hypothetical protein